MLLFVVFDFSKTIISNDVEIFKFVCTVYCIHLFAGSFGLPSCLVSCVCSGFSSGVGAGGVLGSGSCVESVFVV